MLKKFLFFVAGLTSAAIIACVCAYLWFVVYFPGEAIRQENIQQTLAMESPVYCSDGTTKIGVFFQDAHRQYLPFEQLPGKFLNALIAGEDNQFYSHYGIDFRGFSRAMYANVQAGRIVQGGSTITQQTAKNLFKRKGRNVKSKLTELLYALRLEYHYPKEKILEFYSNQFYVSGNGHGLGVAARYYFDKEPQQLDLIEAAFIAGSVKRPNYYNPFIKKDSQSRSLARKRAKERTGYVLRQMYRLGMITAAAYQQSKDEEIPFNRGTMRFKLNTIMDMVKDGLDEPAVEAALLDSGIENVAIAGLHVITTIDKNLQKSNLFALQSELSRLDVRLLGYDRGTMQKQYAKLPFGGGEDLSVGQFLVARVQDVQREEPAQMVVSYGENGNEALRQGVVDQQGLMNLLTPLVRHRQQRWSNASENDLPILLDQIKEGDLVYVSVREHDSFEGSYLFNLEKYPELQGAVLTRQEGKIVAIAGGMDNFYYNRAIAAKRSMGSVVKPLLFAAAIQLGWNSLDPLNNERNMFVYHKSPYIPRPDHKSPHNYVSMSWAGVHSENVASVWLLYHLCDKLTPAQFKEVLDHLGMNRQAEESYSHYKRRVRDSMGIVVGESALEIAAFEKAVAASEADLIFDGKQDQWRALSRFHVSDEFEQLVVDVDDKSLEGEIRRTIVRRNFARYKKLRQNVLAMSAAMQAGGEFFPLQNLYYFPVQEKKSWFSSEDNSLKKTSRICYMETWSGKGWHPVDLSELRRVLAAMSEYEKNEFWQAVLLENILSISTIALLEENFEKQYGKLTALPAYDPEVLHSIRDFRVLAGLRYLIDLCRAMGVESALEPVLSFPLGSNVISLLELSRIYETLTSGMFYASDDSLNAGLSIIDRIEADGEVIYRSRVTEKRLIDEQSVLAVSDILRNVVKYGTGRFAMHNITLHSSDPEAENQLADLDIAIPVLGKTGTANRFINSSFAGLIPGLYGKGNGVNLNADSFVLTSYVGFDDNRPMVKGTTHITGASGALFVWTKVGKSIVLEKNYAAHMDIVDLAFSGRREVPLFYPDLGQIEVPVSLNGGGLFSSLATQEEKVPVISFGKLLPGGEVEPARYFRPYWHFESKEIIQ